MAVLVLVAHGSLKNPDSSAPCYTHAARVRAMGVFSQVLVGFWKEEPSLSRVLAGVPVCEEVYVVPFFMSEGYFSGRVVPRELRAHGPWSVEATLCGVVGTHPDMTEVIMASAQAGLEGSDPAQAAVAIVGHGTTRNKRSSESIRRQVALLKASGVFHEVVAVFLDEAPVVTEVFELTEARRLVVVPMFTSDGYHTRDQIPTYLGLEPEEGAELPIVGTSRGRRVWCAAAIGLEPRMVDVILDRVREAGGDVDSAPGIPVEEGYAPGGERFLEEARRRGRVTWGEVQLEAVGEQFVLGRGGEGERLADVGAVRRWGRLDAQHAYRYLATAKTLRAGWRFGPVDAVSASWALEALYPGRMMALEQLEAGAPVWSLRRVAERHTGMFARIKEAKAEMLEQVVESRCGGCVCVRLWGVEEAREPQERLRRDVWDALKPPCLEPCPALLEDAAVASGGG